MRSTKFTPLTTRPSLTSRQGMMRVLSMGPRTIAPRRHSTTIEAKLLFPAVGGLRLMQPIRWRAAVAVATRRLGVVAVLVGIAVAAGNDIRLRHPARQIDVGAALRAEGAKLRDYRRTADRASAALWSALAHSI